MTIQIAAGVSLLLSAFSFDLTLSRKEIKQTSVGPIITLVSGSPIIRDGRLVGAVTHLLISDPTKGHGIFIENMLKAAEE